jgi:hypothetical protein
MNAMSELERWRGRQLGQYQHAQIIDRLDRQTAGLSLLGAILADAGMSVGLIQADIARLLAVTDQALPVIVDHLALIGDRLDAIEQLLARPRETEAWEFFRSGFRALTSAKEMFEKGSQGLAYKWLDKAIGALSRAVDAWPDRPEFWYLLGIARAYNGLSEDAAEAFSECALYAVSDSPGLASASVLLAAQQFRSVGQQTKARDLLHEFLPSLDRCAEIHLNLAKYHGESGRLRRALELAPRLAAVARAEGVASVEELEEAAAEVCRYKDGPVSRLRKLEEAINRLVDAAKRIGLDYPNDLLISIDLPGFGVDALLRAEHDIPRLAERGEKFASAVTARLEQLDAHAQGDWQRYQAAMTSARDRVMKARERAVQAKKRARERSRAPLAMEIDKQHRTERAYRLAEKRLQRVTSKSIEAQRLIEAYTRVYDEHGKLRPEALKRYREIWKGGKKATKVRQGDEDYDYLLDWYGVRSKYSTDMWTIELALHRAGEGGHKILAELERVRQDVEYATVNVQAAQRSVSRQSAVVEIARQRLADGDLGRELRESVQKADRARQQIERQVKGKVQSAKLRYDSASDKSRKSREAMVGFLQELEDAIQSSTASRARIIPSI